MLKSVAIALLAVLLFSTATLRAATPVVLQEDFSTDPAVHWTLVGDPSLFTWNSSAQNLDAIWDSSKPKTLFYIPLGQTLTRDNPFSFEFDLRLQDILSGNESGKNGPMQIGIGFLNLSATNAGWSRVDWPQSANVVEFNAYPSGFYPGWPVEPTTSPAFVSGSGSQYFPKYLDEFKIQLPLDQPVHVFVSFDAVTQVLTCSWTTNGAPIDFVHRLRLDDPEQSQFARTDDFQVNIFSISSYKSNEGPYADSVLAHGAVDNIVVTIPSAPPITRLAGGLANGHWQMLFHSRADWTYALERTRDFLDWDPVTETTPGTGADLTLTDPTEPVGSAFYRVRATQ